MTRWHPVKVRVEVAGKGKNVFQRLLGSISFLDMGLKVELQGLNVILFQVYSWELELELGF